MVTHKLIKGAEHYDQRGGLKYFNAFEMKEIRRFYEIIASSLEAIRAWQGHMLEKKWFYCSMGAFVINVVEINDFESPSAQLKPLRFVLSHKDPAILAISGGTATGIRAVEPGSRLLVYSNFTLNESKEDDFRFPPDQWSANW